MGVIKVAIADDHKIFRKGVILSLRPYPNIKFVLEADNGQLRARTDATTAAALVASVARDAVDLLGGPLAHRIRECSAQDCALLFLDTSRAGRRRWCSMATCGARAKMAAYRARLPRSARERDRSRSGAL